MTNTLFYNATISDIKELSPIVKQFFLTFEHPVSFLSGQFVIIDFNDLNHQFSTRSYSIADFTDGNTLELCVVLKPDGQATPQLFEMPIGTVLSVSAPVGRFVLTENIEQSIFFICTGTGVAPFRSMIKDLLLVRKSMQNIHLYFGCRTQKDILYQAEFEQFALDFSNFKYTPVLSQEKWQGASGHVHAHYLKVIKKKPAALFYICGWSEMVKATRSNLKALDYTRQEIKIELYD